MTVGLFADHDKRGSAFDTVTRSHDGRRCEKSCVMMMTSSVIYDQLQDQSSKQSARDERQPESLLAQHAIIGLTFRG